MRRGLLLFLPLMAVLSLTRSTPARAKTVVDVRAGALGDFWRCLEGKACPAATLFKSEGVALWARVSRKLRKVTVKQLYLVPTVPAAFRAKYQKRWGAAVAKLAAAGYDRRALLRLGDGKGIVNAAPRVALAFMAIDIVKKSSGRAKTEYVFVVLWRSGYRYHVAYWEDSTHSITRFMTTHKP